VHVGLVQELSPLLWAHGRRPAVRLERWAGRALRARPREDVATVKAAVHRQRRLQAATPAPRELIHHPTHVEKNGKRGLVPVPRAVVVGLS
jgi:hypothetical protein